MKRRNATALLTALAGGALVSLPPGLSGCRRESAEEALIFFSQEEIHLLEQVAETIIPATPRSPGAKAAGIGPFMDRYVADCLEEEAREVLRLGLGVLNQHCIQQKGQVFERLPPAEQQRVLVELDIEAEEHQQSQSSASPHYFTLLKGLTLLGYFTSEAGATQALRYVPVPGKYEGQIPYEAGDRAWAI